MAEEEEKLKLEELEREKDLARLKAEEGIKILKSEEKKEEIAEETGKGKAIIETILDTASQTGYGSDYTALTQAQQEAIVSDSGVIIDQSLLTRLGIHLDSETTSIQDIIAVLERREVPVAFSACTFNLLYDIELIPVPSVDTIHSLISPNYNLFDKPALTLKEVSEKGSNIDLENPGDDDFELTYTLENFIHNRGGNYKFFVGGDNETEFELVVFDNTNKKYYKWGEQEKDKDETHRSEGEFTPGYSSNIGTIEGGSNEIELMLPHVGGETEYYVFFESRATMAEHLPTHEFPWKITQMPDTSTTIQMDGDEKFGSTAGDVTINHPPGALINASKYTEGKYEIDLTVNPPEKYASGVLTVNENLQNSIVTIGEIDADGSDDYTKTEIIDVDLVASTERGIGRVKGTITLRQAGIRQSFVKIESASVFTLDIST